MLTKHLLAVSSRQGEFWKVDLLRQQGGLRCFSQFLYLAQKLPQPEAENGVSEDSVLAS